MEIEIRAKIEEPDKIKATLASRAKFTGSASENDLYLRHASDTERLLVLRIRRKENGAVLTFKGKATGDDTAWVDVDLPLSDPDALQDLLLGSGYVKVVAIKKRRSIYILDGFEVNIDEIENLGIFVEIEGRGEEEERAKIEEKMSDLLTDLGIQEDSIIRRGYVALMLERLSE